MAIEATADENGDLSGLRRSMAGVVIAPGNAGYESGRRCFNALVDRRPAVIARCFHAGDVATAFDFARAQELEVAVRGGGHNPAGHCVCDGGLVIDLSLLRKVEVDGEARLARAEGGATWLDFDSATQAFGLVIGGCAGAAATSESRRDSSSACIHWNECSAAASPTQGATSARHFASFATSPQARRPTSGARRCSSWTSRWRRR